jgi:hypothetical protein
VWPCCGCSSRDLSGWVMAATPARSCFGGLIRSLPDSLPRVVARYRPGRCVRADGVVAPRSGAIRGRVRCTGWHLPDTSIVGKYAAAQTQSRRRSTAQPSPDDHRPCPDAHARPDEDLRRQTPSGRPNHQGNHAFNQALHHPPTVPNPRRSTSSPSDPLTRYRSIPGLMHTSLRVIGVLEVSVVPDLGHVSGLALVGDH